MTCTDIAAFAIFLRRISLSSSLIEATQHCLFVSRPNTLHCYNSFFTNHRDGVSSVNNERFCESRRAIGGVGRLAGLTFV